MFLRSHRSPRRGSTLAEAAIVYNVVFLLTIGLIIVGMGVFRYLQVAAAAREGARWASVHGGQWAKEENGGTLTTQADIYNNAIQYHVAGLDTSGMNAAPTPGGNGTYLKCTVSWPQGQPPVSTPSGHTTVTVTVNYTWIPEGYLGSMTLSSTSKLPISY
ncbi:MAG TPA: hypothetical protein DDY78_23690 [Planctomycetales bacterium]|jgi:hypothetical protein|nr:hypothetical protein [Planctomycetales bacterium]